MLNFAERLNMINLLDNMQILDNLVKAGLYSGIMIA